MRRPAKTASQRKAPLKPIGDMTRLELAAFVGAEFSRRGINVVLSGGSCVSIYSREKYVSMDLDFVNAGFTKRARIEEAMATLGFRESNRFFQHPDTRFIIEFPPGPLAVGEQPVKEIDEIEAATGKVRLLSPTDCIKDRLAWYYHGNDQECLQQAILVAAAKPIDLVEIERWSMAEGKWDAFQAIRNRLKTGSTTKRRT